MKSRIRENILLTIILFAVISATYGNDTFGKITRELQKNIIKEGDFSQKKYLPFLSQPLVSSGSFINNEKDGVIWYVKKPIASTLNITDTGIFIDGSAIQKNNFTVLIQSIFHSLLNTDHKAINDNFIISSSPIPLEKNQTTEQHRYWKFSLTPKSDSFRKVIKSIEMSGEKNIRRIKLIENSAVITIIDFKEIKTTDPSYER